MTYESEARRVDLLRQVETDIELGEYLHGYRKGLVDSRACPDGRPELLALVVQLGADAESTDRMRAARGDGYVDGLAWETPGRRSGLVRMAIRRSGLPARRWAEQVMVRDERTVRRWISGDVDVPDVVLRRIEEILHS